MGWFSKSSEKHDAAKVPAEEIWIRCQGCHAHVFKQDFHSSGNVCPKCQWHGKLTASERVERTIDEGSWKEINASVTPADPLLFVDGKGPYPDKVEQSRAKTGLNESIVTGTGRINGIEVVLGVMDFHFLGGSLGSGTGEKILRAAGVAYEQKRPFIVFSASGGARMHEGILSLMQMAKTCAAIARLGEKKLPYISVLTDPTTGGVSASYAMVGDITLAEPGALVGFAGRRVIEQTIKQKLPDNFQTSEFALEHGFVDCIVHRKDMKETLYKILSYYNR
ncbi:MAG: acetyl-CoA carboxylase carboxyltransferase subunit beta [Chitinispirillaceae bacterium]|nr:acetyl-CoA carboxylase carboxyltransferase subunit beta [Chitinispirillaceae bacterium]